MVWRPLAEGIDEESPLPVHDSSDLRSSALTWALWWLFTFGELSDRRSFLWKALVLDPKSDVVLLSKVPRLEACLLLAFWEVRARVTFLSKMCPSLPKRAVGVLGPPMPNFVCKAFGRSRLSSPC